MKEINITCYRFFIFKEAKSIFISRKIRVCLEIEICTVEWLVDAELRPIDINEIIEVDK